MVIIQQLMLRIPERDSGDFSFCIIFVFDKFSYELYQIVVNKIKWTRRGAQFVPMRISMT